MTIISSMSESLSSAASSRSSVFMSQQIAKMYATSLLSASFACVAKETERRGLALALALTPPSQNAETVTLSRLSFTAFNGDVSVFAQNQNL